MPQVVPVNVEFAVIIHMNKLVYERVFHVPLVEEPALAQYDCTSLWAEAAGARKVAWRAYDVLRRNVAPRESEVLEHEHNLRTWRKQSTHESRGREDCNPLILTVVHHLALPFLACCSVVRLKSIQPFLLGEANASEDTETLAPFFIDSGVAGGRGAGVGGHGESKLECNRAGETERGRGNDLISLTWQMRPASGPLKSP